MQIGIPLSFRVFCVKLMSAVLIASFHKKMHFDQTSYFSQILRWDREVEFAGFCVGVNLPG